MRPIQVINILTISIGIICLVGGLIDPKAGSVVILCALVNLMTATINGK